MSAKIVNKAEKKALILIAAISVFAKKGFAKATINDIAEASGIGKGTVYEYFGSKDEIIHEAFVFFIKSMFENFDRVVTADIDAQAKLKELLYSLCHMTESESGDYLDIMFDFWSEGIRQSDSNEVLKKDMKGLYTQYRELIARVIVQGIREKSFRDNVDPEAISVALVGMLDGVMVQWILEKKDIDIQSTVDGMLDIFINGMKRR